MTGLMEGIAAMALALALLPLLLGLWNLLLFRTPKDAPPPGTAVSILIPARNEESNIGDAVRAALSSTGLELEVVVLDDHSTDRTGMIVRDIAASDRRVRLEQAPPLPPGWSGKQHACDVLGLRARHPILLYQDADVRLRPGAAAAGATFLLRRSDLGLVSGFPQELTETMAERLVVPQIHVLLLGYLPMAFMRLFRSAGFGAGCGQFMMARADAYRQVGGHAVIRGSLHDGVTLPRAFRRAGFMTDIFDATRLAHCRMYRGWDDVWNGFSKNATEGMATPVALPVWTVLLAGGHLLPWLLAPAAAFTGDVTTLAYAAGAIASVLTYRCLLAWRFRQDWQSVLLHPAGVVLMLAIQWSALLNHRKGRPAVWRGRTYSGAQS
ncbi:glycosyltransferase [Indioceanicola profundi]|uniref:glycosyltransferase n=1 Tax=Indioceanicola profundi TaxID=2220096 RepID=UPI001CEC6996|nr:glycosyltransferase [Indioceanicola profundi]